jgi:hypothetical protein
MKSFAGGAHAWRMSAWRQIPIIHPGLFFTVRKILPLMKCLKETRNPLPAFGFGTPSR